MKKNNKGKRVKCLSKNEVAYLLLASSVITGCTQEVQKLSNYQEALDYCKNTPAYCQEAEKLEDVIKRKAQEQQANGASGSFEQGKSASSGGSFLNYYLMYHLFFSRSSGSAGLNSSNFQNRFSNFNAKEYKDKEENYRGRGVYSAGYVSRMHNSISTGKTSFESSDGKVYKSAQFKGSSKSSLTGKTVSRGGFGSIGRSHGISS